MGETYVVTQNRRKVGIVTLLRMGLYYEITCQCKIADDEMVDLILEANEKTENLGIMIPVGGSLELRRKIPTKMIGKGSPEFFLQSRGGHPLDFMEVSSDTPFNWLHRLDDCILAVRNGKIGAEYHPKKSDKKDEINT